MIDKTAGAVDEALSGIEDGATVMIGGFGEVGSPIELIHALIERGTRNLTAINNNTGNGEVGLAALIGNGQVRKMICSYPRSSRSKVFPELYRAGKIELELVPQGTLAERIRAGGAGVPAFYTPTSVGTPLSEGKETREFEGRTYVLEHWLKADVALVKCEVADRTGNLTYNKTARNFSPAHVHGGPDHHRAGPSRRRHRGHRSRVRRDSRYLRRSSHRGCRAVAGIGIDRRGEEFPMSPATKPIAGWTREQMAARAAEDIPDKSYVNLGIGIPELVAEFVPAGREFIYHTENGLLGMGPPPKPGLEDPELINAGKKQVTTVPGASFFHHADSFAMIRGGHIDVCVLGALQVSARGDLANWSTGAPGAIPAVGGAMDLVAGVPTIFVITNHVTKTGDAKLVEAVLVSAHRLRGGVADLHRPRGDRGDTRGFPTSRVGPRRYLRRSVRQAPTLAYDPWVDGVAR